MLLKVIPLLLLFNLATYGMAALEEAENDTHKRSVPSNDLLRIFWQAFHKQPDSGGGNPWQAGIPYRPVRRLGSEFLGKRDGRTCRTDQTEMRTKRSIGYDQDVEANTRNELMKRQLETFEKRIGSEFLGKRGMGSEFLGKRGMGSEFLGKREMGSEFLGKRGMGSEFLGKRGMGSEFLGKRRMGSEFLGKRRMGSEFLGKRGAGNLFSDKRVSEFLRKIRIGSEFLGKRAMETTDLGKRGMGSEFLGKRSTDSENFNNGLLDCSEQSSSEDLAVSKDDALKGEDDGGVSEE